MRNPNGYGAVINLGKNRRNPYAVRLTVDYDLIIENGLPQASQKYKYIGYYPTRKEAMLALAKYNANPYDLKNSDITFSQAYEHWFAERFPTEESKKTASCHSYTAAYKKCSSLYSMKLRDIKTPHLQKLMTEKFSNSTLSNIVGVCNAVFEWAIKNDILDKNYAKYIQLPKAEKSEIHKMFTQSEIAQLWLNIGNPYVADTIMLIYSGLRIGEFLALTYEDVHISDRYINIRKAKTKAGVRIVPIADKTLSLWKHWKPSKVSYAKYSKEWVSALESLGLQHLLHDTRHTCVSLLTAAGVALPITQKIVGHSGKSVTENVYLHLELPSLLTAINSI